MQNNKEYIEIVVSEKLYDKANQKIDQPFDSQGRKISQILSLNEVVKSFWIKAKIRIKNSEDSVYFLACPSCSKSYGAAYKYEFTCFYCNYDFPGPKPLLWFYVEPKEASMLLCMSEEDIIETEEQETPFNPDIFNQKSKDLQFLFQLRTSWSKARGKTFVRNPVIACLPAVESSSALHSYEDKGSSSKARGLIQGDVAAAESQKSSSAMQEEHFEADLKAPQPSPTCKRRLECVEVLHESKKHVKQD